MKTSDFDYDLPQELIAQEPAAVRDACRMLVMDRETGAIEDRIFRDIIDYLEPGDLLVANETRVLPARLLGAKRGTGSPRCSCFASLWARRRSRMRTCPKSPASLFPAKTSRPSGRYSCVRASV